MELTVCEKAIKQLSDKARDFLEYRASFGAKKQKIAVTYFFYSTEQSTSYLQAQANFILKCRKFYSQNPYTVHAINVEIKCTASIKKCDGYIYERICFESHGQTY